MGLVGVVALGFVWFNALYSHKAKTDAQPTTYAQGGEQYTAPPPATPKPAPVPIPAMPAPSEQSSLVSGQPQQPRSEDLFVCEATLKKVYIAHFAKRIRPGRIPIAC
jgi:type IV secretion system protein VirB10